MANLIFKDAEVARDAIMASQKKEIADLYEKWSDEIGEKAKYYSRKSTASSVVSERQMKELKKQLRATSQEVSNEIYKKIKNNMYIISDTVIADNVKWLESFGFSPEGLNAAFSYVSDNVVRNLITGQIYEGNWNLSKAIWSDNEKALKDVYGIVAKGVAQNMSIYDIAKNLEVYVSPSKKKPWNLVAPDGVKIYKKTVDYNAQRLARTLVQHSYQQSFIATTQKNPFITEYIWHSNGSRVCPLCLDRDGAHFSKDNLPMDHPNGMCVMEPVIVGDMVDQLANWFNSPDGTYPEIDEFAGNFGYNAQKNGTVSDFVNKYGKSDKTLSAWKQSMTQVQKAEAKLLKDAEGLTWEQFYSKHVYSGNASEIAEQQAKIKAAKAAKKAEKKAGANVETIKAFNGEQGKYLKPYGFTPQNMPVDFDDWSHKISYNQASEILESMGTSWKDPHPYQQLMKYYNANLTSANLVDTGIAKVATKVDDVATTVKANKVAAVSKTTKTSSKVPKATSWIDNIKNQTESHMLELEDEAMKLIGEAGRNGIKIYTGQAYKDINSYLRCIQSGMDEATAIAKSGIDGTRLKAAKDAISGLDNVKLTEDLVLRRGTDLGDLAGAFMSGDFETNKYLLHSKSVEELNDMFSGAVGQLGSLTSTSSIWDRGFSGDVEVIYYAPKGASASSIMSISKYDTSEGETLLNAGTKVRCAKVEKSDGHKGSYIRVFMEILTK